MIHLLTKKNKELNKYEFTIRVSEQEVALIAQSLGYVRNATKLKEEFKILEEVEK